MLASVPPTMTDDPPCSPADGDHGSPPAVTGALRAVRRPFDAIDPAAWDALAGANPWATPFSAWAFHRAWWDAYGANAHEETLVLVPADAPDDAAPVAIVPLMHRHAVEPGDLALHTTIRHTDGPALTPVAPDAKEVFFGASYHADYATLLAAPADLRAAAEGLAAYCASNGDPAHPDPWDAVDLRRLRCADPAADALAEAFGRREIARGWTMSVEQEDVCPVATLPAGASLDDVMAALGKKERHEIRRKVRRAEAVGRGPARGVGRPARGDRRLHRPPPAQVGRARPVPRHARWRPEPGVRPAPVRAVGRATGRCGSRSCPSAAGGSRPGSRSRRPTACSTTTRALTPTPATCRRGW